MPSLIKKFTDGSTLEYDTGAFDDWCVYLTRPNIKRYAPKDPEYFEFFKNLGIQFNSQRVYDDFTIIYNLTSNQIEQDVLKKIDEIATNYTGYQLVSAIWFTVVYAGMVAEQNKVNTKLGKRIKRLGMNQALLQNFTSSVAANFSRGKRWLELNKIMIELGF